LDGEIGLESAEALFEYLESYSIMFDVDSVEGKKVVILSNPLIN